jgi:hypothetical protein
MAQPPTSFLFVVNELSVNDEPYRGGRAPRSDAMGHWLPPIHSAGFGTQRPGYMFRWSDGTITDISHTGYQWYNGEGWYTNYANVSTLLAHYETTSLFWCNDFTQFLMLESDATREDMETADPPHNQWFPLTFLNMGRVSRVAAAMSDQYLAGNSAWWIQRLGLEAYRSLERDTIVAASGLGGRLATVFALVAFSCRDAAELRAILTSHGDWRRRLGSHNAHGSMLSIGCTLFYINC